MGNRIATPYKINPVVSCLLFAAFFSHPRSSLLQSPRKKKTETKLLCRQMLDVALDYF